MYTYQETNRPFLCDIPESAWETVSRHRTLRAAVKAFTKGWRAMRRRCGTGAWDCNRRIIEPSGHAVPFRIIDGIQMSIEDEHQQELTSRKVIS